MNNASKVLIKIGGAALKDDSVLDTVTESIRKFRRNGHKVVVVHGGGPAINAALTKAGLTWDFIEGQRFTTPAMMSIIEETLCGSVNRKLVRQFGAAGLPVMGFSGTDNHTLMCARATTEKGQDLGQVGEIRAVNCAWIEVLMRLPSAPIPVIAPIGIGHKGEAFNINADWAATRLASALGVSQLLFFTDQDGILDQNRNLIPTLTIEQLEGLMADGTVHGGMLTKAKSILHARKSGINTVRVMNGKKAMEAAHDESLGTLCKAEVQPQPKSRMAEFYASA